MPEWKLHWLEAEGDLGPWRDCIKLEIEAAREKIARVVLPPRLDILIQRVAGAAIPETGFGAHAHRKGLFSLTLDPDNVNFTACLHDDALRRAVAHEVHHCLRMATPGHCRTLGEALVSEGLAGQFVGHIFGSQPELWERAICEDRLQALLPTKAMLEDVDDDHDEWFYGVNGRCPRWLGYTLGYRIVGDWLAAQPSIDGDTWINIPAATVLAAAHNGVLSSIR